MCDCRADRWLRNICTLWVVAVMICTTTAEVPDVVLLSKAEQSGPQVCAAGRDASHSAISWIADITPQWREPKSTPVVSCKSKWECDPDKDDCCPQWHNLQGWQKVSSLKYELPHVLDYRWESFKQVITEVEAVVLTNGLPADSWSVDLSVRAPSNAQLFLCSKNKGNPWWKDNCYYVILGRWASHTGDNTVIRECTESEINVGKNVNSSPTGDCNIAKDSNKNPFIGKDHWLHFRIRWDDIKKYLTFTRFEDEEPFLSYKPERPYGIRSILARTPHNVGLWKVHDYKSWYPREPKARLANDYIPPYDKRICISIQYYLLPGYRLDFELFLGTNSKGEQFESYELLDDGQWHEIHLQANNNEMKSVSITIEASDLGGAGIGNIRACESKGETRISKWSKEGVKPVCHLLQNNISLDPAGYSQVSDDEPIGCENGNFLANCSQNCTTLAGSKSCEGYILYVQRGETQVWSCGAGFRSRYCNLSCDKGYYGWGCNNDCGNCTDICNPVDGVCEGGCTPGFHPDRCKTKYPFFRHPPKLLDRAAKSLSFSVDISNHFGEGTLSILVLQYKEKGSKDEWSWSPLRENVTDQTQYVLRIENLTPGTIYAVRGIILTDETLAFYENEDVPVTIANTTCVDPKFYVIPEQTSVTLTNQAQEEDCPAKLYQYFITGYNKNETKVLHEYTVDILGLLPHKNYSILVKNTVNYRPIFTRDFTTKQGPPSEVSGLTAISDVTSMQLNWGEPEHLNGDLTGYSIIYKHLKYRGCADDVPADPIEKSMSTADRTIRLEKLLPYSQYEVRVAAKTVAIGNYVNIKEVTAAEAVPSETPTWAEEITYQTVVSIYVDNPEDCTKITGPLDNILVQIVGIDEWDLRNETRIETPPRILIKNLIPYSRYNISLFYNRAGSYNLQAGVSKEIITKPANPSEVREPEAYSFWPRNISLRWKPPYPPYGELDGYEVNVLNTGRAPLKDTTQCPLWPNYQCATVKGISQGNVYYITIIAINKENLRGVQKRITVRAEERAPGPVKNVEPIPGTLQATLSWDYPWLPRGKLQKFIVEASFMNSSLLDKGLNKNMKITCEEDIIELRALYSCTLRSLYPSTKYRATVKAVSTLEGEPQQVAFTTDTAHPNFLETVHVEEVTDNTVTITLPAAAQYMTSKSASFVVVTFLQGIMPDDDDDTDMYDKALQRHLLDRVLSIHQGKKSWIAAEIQLRNSHTPFVVGLTNQSNSALLSSQYGSKYNNRRLAPKCRYQITVVSVNFASNSYLSGYSSLLESVETGGNPLPGRGDYSLLALLVLIFIPILLFLAYRRYKKKKSQPKESDGIPLHRPDTKRESLRDRTDILGIKVKPPIPLPPAKPENEVENEFQQEAEDAALAQPLTQRLSCRVAVNNLEQYVRNSLVSGELQRQHALFPRKPTQPCEYGRLPQNKPKNRYGNLIAYDATRVVLKKLPDDEFSDYINANYIEGYNSPKFYIATQGPKPNTVADFWRMVWQEDVTIISMLANVVESGKTKCEQYWPELGKEVTYKAVAILNTSTQVFADYTYRTLQVTHKGRKRMVQHLHFTSWPDHGVPLYPQSAASYMKKMLSFPKGPGPILVHCSAGVGRTGTIILADICIRMAAAENAVDVLLYQQRIREQRTNMVDNLEQYKFVHSILLECLVEEASDIPCEGDFESHVKQLRNNGGIDRQFQRLRKYALNQRLTSLEKKEPPKLSQRAQHKNRNQNIIPESYGQVYLTQVALKDPTSTYINAVCVDGFRTKNQFIVTQFPLADTVGDFWRMVVEKGISLIVILNEIDLRDSTVVKFLPSSECVIHPETYLEVKENKVNEHDLWNLHFLQVTDSSLEDQPRQESVRVLKFKGWHSQNNLPPSSKDLLMLWKETESVYMGKGPILVTCLDGAKACGLFLALTFLIEKVKLEQVCDACQAVRTVCQSRSQFIATQDQFEFLYDAVISYLEGFQVYANFQ